MLKFVVRDTPAKQCWTLIGKLIEPWASEVRKNWKETRRGRAGKACVVDLRDVTLLDESGRKLLREMMRERAQFLTTGVYLGYVIESLAPKRAAAKRRRR